MIVLLKTWRYTQEATNVYHGESFTYSPETMTLTIYRPFVSGKDAGITIADEGMCTVVTVIAGDEFTVLECGSECPEQHARLGDLSTETKGARVSRSGNNARPSSVKGRKS